MRRLLFLMAVLFFSFATQAQQDYVPRFDAFTGFSYLASPKLNLAQRGFNGEYGVNVNRWLALGADYSVFTGHSSLTPNDLALPIQAELAPFQPLLPPGYILSVPFDATTQTFSAGPQFNLRKWKPVTLFIRPAFGLLREHVTARPADAIQTQLVGVLVPGNSKSDKTVFYGFGGGFDLISTKYVGIRFAADFVHVNLFSDFLKESRNSVRMSVGPTWRWGRNVQ